MQSAGTSKGRAAVRSFSRCQALYVGRHLISCSVGRALGDAERFEFADPPPPPAKRKDGAHPPALLPPTVAEADHSAPPLPPPLLGPPPAQPPAPVDIESVLEEIWDGDEPVDDFMESDLPSLDTARRDVQRGVSIKSARKGSDAEIHKVLLQLYPEATDPIDVDVSEDVHVALQMSDSREAPQI